MEGKGGLRWSFCLLVLLPLQILSTPINRQVGISENVFITVQNDTYGNEQRVCSIDSVTYVDGDSIPTSSPCEHCICRPPGFACTIISCEYRPGCKALKRSDQCCPEYQCECEKDGKIYQNGEKILDNNNPCEVCYCQGGDVICAVIDCYWRSDCQPRYIENRCCPLYDHCGPPQPVDLGPLSRPISRPISSTTEPSSTIAWMNLSSAVNQISSSSELPVVIPVAISTLPPVEIPETSSSEPPVEEHPVSPSEEKPAASVEQVEVTTAKVEPEPVSNLVSVVTEPAPATVSLVSSEQVVLEPTTVEVVPSASLVTEAPTENVLMQSSTVTAEEPAIQATGTLETVSSLMTETISPSAPGDVVPSSSSDVISPSVSAESFVQSSQDFSSTNETPVAPAEPEVVVPTVSTLDELPPTTVLPVVILEDVKTGFEVVPSIQSQSEDKESAIVPTPAVESVVVSQDVEPTTVAPVPQEPLINQVDKGVVQSVVVDEVMTTTPVTPVVSLSSQSIPSVQATEPAPENVAISEDPLETTPIPPNVVVDVKTSSQETVPVTDPVPVMNTYVTAPVVIQDDNERTTVLPVSADIKPVFTDIKTEVEISEPVTDRAPVVDVPVTSPFPIVVKETEGERETPAAVGSEMPKEEMVATTPITVNTKGSNNDYDDDTIEIASLDPAEHSSGPETFTADVTTVETKMLVEDVTQSPPSIVVDVVKTVAETPEVTTLPSVPLVEKDIVDAVADAVLEVEDSPVADDVPQSDMIVIATTPAIVPEEKISKLSQDVTTTVPLDDVILEDEPVATTPVQHVQMEQDEEEIVVNDQPSEIKAGTTVLPQVEEAGVTASSDDVATTVVAVVLSDNVPKVASVVDVLNIEHKLESNEIPVDSGDSKYRLDMSILLDDSEETPVNIAEPINRKDEVVTTTVKSQQNATEEFIIQDPLSQTHPEMPKVESLIRHDHVIPQNTVSDSSALTEEPIATTPKQMRNDAADVDDDVVTTTIRPFNPDEDTVEIAAADHVVEPVTTEIPVIPRADPVEQKRPAVLSVNDHDNSDVPVTTELPAMKFRHDLSDLLSSVEVKEQAAAVVPTTVSSSHSMDVIGESNKVHFDESPVEVTSPRADIQEDFVEVSTLPNSKYRDEIGTTVLPAVIDSGSRSEPVQTTVIPEMRSEDVTTVKTLRNEVVEVVVDDQIGTTEESIIRNDDAVESTTILNPGIFLTQSQVKTDINNGMMKNVEIPRISEDMRSDLPQITPEKSLQQRLKEEVVQVEEPWLYRTFNRLRSLFQFPKLLTRHPRSTHKVEKPSKTPYAKTKKAHQELPKKPVKQITLPSRRFLFW